MLNFIRALGIAAPLIGLVTAISAFMPGYGSLVALICMPIGFIISSAYLFLSSRVGIEHEKCNPAYIGLALCSVPILLIIVLNFFG